MSKEKKGILQNIPDHVDSGNNGSVTVSGKTYWRSLDQLADTPQFRKFLENEFPEGTIDLPSQLSRRKFLGLMGASLALAGLTACRRPVEKILPYVTAPEEIIPGIPKYYASSMPFGLNALGVVVETHEGRPTKIEGNAKHSASLGSSNAFVQASVLNLYDPDRSQTPLHYGNEVSWREFLAAWNELKTEYSENGGEGLAVLSESFASPTIYGLREQFMKTFPKASWVAWEPVSDENVYKGLEIATGKVYQPVYQFSKADVVLSLDSDFLYMDPNNIANTRGFSQARRVESEKDSMNRLYVVENSFTVTGGMADHRLKLANRHIAAFTRALARELQYLGVPVDVTIETAGSGYNFDEEWLKTVAVELATHKGKSIVLAGYRQPAEVHALVFAINDALRNSGKTILYYNTGDRIYSDSEGYQSLTADLKKGKVDTLVILGGNPVYSDPAGLDFGAAMKKPKHVIHFSYEVNETSAACEWHLPRTHYLESWGDTRAFDGTAGVIQPMIAPLFDCRSEAEFLNMLINGEDSKGYELVRRTWEKGFLTGNYEKQWRRVLHEGLLPDSAAEIARPRLQTKSLSRAIGKSPAFSDTGDGLELVFSPSSATFDGRFANNGWLMECPDPMTKVTWDNVAVMSRNTASKLGLKNKELATFQVNGRSVTLPVWILPGQADDSITVTLGFGRNSGGRIAKGVGQNVYPLKPVLSDVAVDVKVSGTGQLYTIATTQDHHGMEGVDLADNEISTRLPAIIREATLEEYKHEPGFAHEVVEEPELFSLWEEKKYDKGYQWGMAIDLNLCTGCNACSIACQSENNIPVVGKSEVEKGREMSWIRLDRYFTGDIDNPEIAFQPVACQHCEMAPCEQVCPVTATVHDDEGLNAMVYNRCVGTRYCANNCPYKVRRFNFYNYTKDLPEIVHMVQNPDVTVRFRGVMEKCSYCTQRINYAKIQAKNDNRTVQDGDIVAACQQACPAEAIVFGDINDSDSQVSKLKKQNRNYSLLGEINTRPRTTYLARLRNPNGDLEA